MIAIRKCRNCGISFDADAGGDQLYCDDCIKSNENEIQLQKRLSERLADFEDDFIDDFMDETYIPRHQVDINREIKSTEDALLNSFSFKPNK